MVNVWGPLGVMAFRYVPGGMTVTAAEGGGGAPPDGAEQAAATSARSPPSRRTPRLLERCPRGPWAVSGCVTSGSLLDEDEVAGRRQAVGERRPLLRAKITATSTAITTIAHSG